jgi:hypothetical protein
MKDERFSLSKFFLGIIKTLFSPAWWAWAFSNILTWTALHLDGDHTYIDKLVIGNIIINIFFICGKMLPSAISRLIAERAELNISVGGNKTPDIKQLGK